MTKLSGGSLYSTFLCSLIICASRTKQAGDSRKMLAFHRQIVDSFEAPCGNIDGKCTQSDRWRPTACSGKFFGEHRSISRTISTSFLLWLPFVLFVRLFEPWIQVTHTPPHLCKGKNTAFRHKITILNRCAGEQVLTRCGRDCQEETVSAAQKRVTGKKGHSQVSHFYGSNIPIG